MKKVSIEFNHGWATPIATTDSNVELFKRIKCCEVIVDGNELHPVDINVLAINLGYNSSEEMFNAYPNDVKGWLCNGSSIEEDSADSLKHIFGDVHDQLNNFQIRSDNPG